MCEFVYLNNKVVCLGGCWADGFFSSSDLSRWGYARWGRYDSFLDKKTDAARGCSAFLKRRG